MKLHAMRVRQRGQVTLPKKIRDELRFDDGERQELPSALERLLSDLRAGLEEIYRDRLRDVVLCGSHARGTAGPDSDVDVLVVLDEMASSWEEIKRTSRLRADLSLTYGTSLDTHFSSRREWQEGEAPFFVAARREGLAV